MSDTERSLAVEAARAAAAGKAEAGAKVATALGSADLAAPFGSWFAHLWPNDSAAAAFTAFVAARSAEAGSAGGPPAPAGWTCCGGKPPHHHPGCPAHGVL